MFFVFQLGQESLSDDIFPNDIALDEREALLDLSLSAEELSDTNCILNTEEENSFSTNPLVNCDFFNEVETFVENPLANCESLVYDTLNASSDVLYLLSNDVPSPPSSMATVNCPEGILIDLGEKFFTRNGSQQNDYCLF